MGKERQVIGQGRRAVGRGGRGREIITSMDTIGLTPLTKITNSNLPMQ